MPRGDGDPTKPAPFGEPRKRRLGPSRQTAPNPNASKRAKRRAQRNGKVN